MQMETKITIGSVLLTEASSLWNRVRKAAFHIIKD